MKTILLQMCLLLISWPALTQIDLQLDLVSNAFDKVVDIANAGDDRLFVVEKDGRIRILQANGAINGTPFLDIDAQVSSTGERGLLGLAFHPMYADNGYFFVNYTNNSGSTIVARYQVSAGNPDLADAQSETILLTILQPFDNHNGGDLSFGPDGYLYICTGDGGDGGDPQDNGQDTTTPLGKVLRIDVDNGTGSAPDYEFGSGYTIPTSNPLADGPGNSLDEIWALGLRNPWRFSFDRLTGDMWIGDVGQGAWEEIDFEPAGSPGGLNYGWRCYEGDHTFNTTGCGAASLYTFPVHEYGRGDGSCSVTGGYVYRGADFPLLYGLYLYSDYCNGMIWGLKNEGGEWVNEPLFDSVNQPTTMGEDYRGELYLGSLDGSLYRVVETACPNLVVNDDPISGGTYQAGEVLTSSGTVANGSNVVFKAGTAIVLQTGFLAEAGSAFQALIEACTPAADLVARPPQTEEYRTMQPAPDLQLFPNPFRLETTIRYSLPEPATVDIRVWDLYGKPIAQPVAGQWQEAGVYNHVLSAQALPAGIYLVVFRAGARQEIGRMEVLH